MRRVAPCGNCRVLSREHGPAVRVRPPERRGPYVIAVAVHSLGVVSVHRYSSMRRTFPFAVCLVVARVLEALAGQAVPAPGQPTFENRLFANAAIAMTSGLTPSQHFTSDRQRLLAAAERFRGRYVPRSRRVWGSVEGSFGRSPVAQDPGPDAMDRERQIKAWNARRMLRSVERFAEWMGGLDARRKAIVLIGQGIDYDTRDLFGDRDALVLLEETSHVAGATARHKCDPVRHRPSRAPYRQEVLHPDSGSRRRVAGCDVARETEPSCSRRGNRRSRVHQLESIRSGVRARRPRTEHVLPAGLPRATGCAGRAAPSHSDSSQSSGRDRPGAPQLRSHACSRRTQRHPDAGSSLAG